MLIYHTKKLNGKKYMKTLVVTEKVFDKIQRSFMIKKKKTFHKVGIEEIYLNIIKAIYNKLIAKIILNGEKLKAFPLKSGTKQGCPSHHYYSI